MGLAAAAIWRCMVYLTDLPDIVDNLLLNVHSNCATVGRHGGTPVAGVLDWTKPPAGDLYSVSEGVVPTHLIADRFVGHHCFRPSILC